MNSICDKAICFVHNKYTNATQNLTDARNNIQSRLISIKDNFCTSIKNISMKIKNFFLRNKEIFIFAALQAIAFFHGPIRFMAASIISLVIQKEDFKSQDPVVSPFSYTLNILGFLGIILEKTICPVCDPSFYLAPCLNGIAFTNTVYNFYQSKNIIDN